MKFAKTVINHIFRLETSFQEILYMIDVWINEESGSIVESIESQYINASTFRPLSGSSYISLPEKLKSPKKRLITSKTNIKNAFYGAMLDIVILQKNIQKELQNRQKYC